MRPPILEPWLVELLTPGVVLAGGYARYLCMDGAPLPSDIDLFLLEGTDDAPLLAALAAQGYPT